MEFSPYERVYQKSLTMQQDRVSQQNRNKLLFIFIFIFNRH